VFILLAHINYKTTFKGIFNANSCADLMLDLKLNATSKTSNGYLGFKCILSTAMDEVKTSGRTSLFTFGMAIGHH